VKKELNFELNILPILDILSVLICFLLLTAVWIQVGTLDTHQAIGDNAVSGAANPPSLWISVSSQGNLKFSFKDMGANGVKDTVLMASSAGIDWKSLGEKIQGLHTQWPTLKTVVITPEARANYGDVIRLMDQLKQNQLTDIGLSPLS
jgi:biopolymer transport protein ExbD